MLIEKDYKEINCLFDMVEKEGTLANYVIKKYGVGELTTRAARFIRINLDLAGKKKVEYARRIVDPKFIKLFKEYDHDGGPFAGERIIAQIALLGRENPEKLDEFEKAMRSPEAKKVLKKYACTEDTGRVVDDLGRLSTNPVYFRDYCEGMLVERKEKKGGLEGSLAIIGLLSGIFFLSTNITGNAIANLNVQNSSFLGAGLLVVGLVAGFFWVKKK